jgi:hypothetical protein
MGNSGLPQFGEPLGKLAQSEIETVSEAARWALAQLHNLGPAAAL